MCVETRSFFTFTNNSESRSIKNREHAFADIGKYKTCAKCQQKILNSMVVAPPQSFRFFRQKTWFLENNRGLSKLLYEILHDLINKISP